MHCSGPSICISERQVREYAIWISGLLVLVVLRLALDPRQSAAFVCVGIGKDEARVQAELGIEPPVAVGRVFVMVFPEQKNIGDEILLPFRWMGKLFLPRIEAASPNAHDPAKCLDRKLSGKLQDYLILLTYRMTEPSPFTS